MNTMRGFTLIELMMVLAIMGILAAWGVPSFKEMIAQNRLVTNANNLVYAFQLARSEAITRARPIDVVAATGGWKNGWRIEQPDPNDPCGAPDPATDATTLKSWEAMAGASRITATAYIGTTSGATCYRFNGQGRLSADGFLNLCDDRTGEKGKQVNLNKIGRASVDDLPLAPSPDACS